jgi:hypothetical protein
VDFPGDGISGTPNGVLSHKRSIRRGREQDRQLRPYTKGRRKPRITELFIDDGSGVNKLEYVGGRYEFKEGMCARPGDVISVRLASRLSPQKLTVDLYSIDSDSSHYGSGGELTCQPSGEMHIDFAIPDVSQPNGTYTFKVYGGNGNPVLADEDTYLEQSITLVTTYEIDPEPPNVPVIYQSSLDYYGDGSGGAYKPVWLRAMADIDVYYAETEGSAEWLEYAVYEGIDPSYRPVILSRSSAATERAIREYRRLPVGRRRRPV